jgi:hypothetical protein
MKALFLIFLMTLLPTLTLAAECTAYTPQTISSEFTKPLNQISKFEILKAAKDCLLGVLNGVWEATVGVAKSAMDCIWNPIDCMESAVDGVKNAYLFISNLSSELSKIWGSLKNMTGQQVMELLCGLVGEIGTDVLIAILTAGAASGKLGITVAKVMLKIQKISRLLGHFVGMPLKLLRELADSSMDALEAIIKRGDKDIFMRRIQGAGCAFR